MVKEHEHQYNTVQMKVNYKSFKPSTSEGQYSNHLLRKSQPVNKMMLL